MPRKLRILGGPRYVAPAPPPADIELTSLLFSANFFDKDTVAGTVLADILPAPEPGETRAFVPATTSSSDVYLNAGGTQILRGSGSGWTSAGDIAYNVRRTLAAAINSPLDTTWNVTLYTPGDIPVVEVGAAWNGTADSGWAGSAPVSTTFDNTTARTIINLAVSWHETITGDTLLCFDAEAAFGKVASVDALVEGNSVNIPAASWQEIVDPRTGATVPLYGYWFKLIKPASDTGTIRVRGQANSSDVGLQSTISPAYDFYPRAAAYTTLIKVAYNASDPAATPGYTGATGLTTALNYKGAHPTETVWIEVLDNPPSLGWNIGTVSSVHLSPTVWTKIYGKAGSTIRIGNYTTAGMSTRIDGLWFGENLELDLSAMGNGSSAIMLQGTQRVKLWGAAITGGDPETEGGASWSGAGAAALYNRRQPSGFWIYPATSSTTCTVIAGFNTLTDMPAFGLGYTNLAIYNYISDVSGSCFEGSKGAVLFNEARRIGGRQAGLRSYMPAIRIVANRTTWPYIAIEKTPTNGNVISSGQVPSTLTTAGSGYTDGVFDARAPEFPRWTCTGGSGTGMLFDVVVSGGVVTSAKCVKSTLMGTGYRAGDVLTLKQTGVTPATEATVTLGSTFRLYGGASAGSATIIGEMLLYSGMSHLDAVAMLDAVAGVTATSLSPTHDLDVSFLTYDAQPAAGISTANKLANAIAKMTWTGTTFDLALGQDIHSDVLVYPGTWRNLTVRYNRFIDYVESAPWSFGTASRVNGMAVTHNCWLDTTGDYSGLTAQQGYMQGGGVHPHIVFRHNTQVSKGPNGTGGWFFGTGYSAGAFVEITQNLTDGFGWSVPRDDDVYWHNNLHRLRTQAQVNALTATPSSDGDSRGLDGASIASIWPNLIASDSFTPTTAARLADLSWAGALNSSGDYAGIPPAP